MIVCQIIKIKFLSSSFSGECSAGQKDAGLSILNHCQNTIQLSSCKQKYHLQLKYIFDDLPNTK